MFKRFWQNGRDLLTRPQSSIFSAAFIIALTYGVSMVLGIFRDRILVAKFYSCCRGQLDSYYAAFRLPDIIFQLIVIGALSSAFIPVFSEKLAKDEKEAYRLSSTLINLFLSVFLVLCVIIFIFAKPLSSFIAGGFSLEQINLMANMTRVMLAAQIFFLVSNFSSAMNQCKQRFLIPSLSPIAYNFGIVSSVALFASKWGIWSAAFGVVLGAFLHFLIQLPLLFKLGYRHSFIVEITPAVKKVIRLMIPRTLALAASQIELTYSVFLATTLSSGSLTIYSLAQRLVDLPVRLLGTSVGQAALPILSSQVARGKKEEFKKTLNQSLSHVFYLAFPATALFLVLRLQAVRFAYGAKSFPWQATVVTSQTLAMVTLSIFSQCAIQLLVRGFYAFHDTITPFLISLFSVAINIALSIFYVRERNLGILGLATAFSISNLVNFLCLLIFLNARKLRFISRQDIYRYLKMILASICAAFFAWLTLRLLDQRVFDTTRNLPLLGLTLTSGLAGLLVYILLSVLFKLNELSVLLKIGHKFGKWRETLFSVKEVIDPQSGSSGSSS